jgi:hypothetical protein
MTRAADLAKLIAGSSTLGGTGELVLKDVDTADGSSPKITFQTGDTDIAADDVLGTIDFQAPDEGTGTDAILVSAGVEAKAEGDFSSSSNATSLTFKTGSSEAAAEKVRVTSAGNLGIGTTSPSQSLETTGSIFINSSGNPFLEVKTSGAGNNPFVRIKADSNYWDLQTLFSNTNDELDFRYNGTSTMMIDKSGHITKPLQSAFLAQLSTAQANVATGSGQTIQFDTEIFDQNADFNPSSYTFTAPVTGRYQFNFLARYNSLDSGASYYQGYVVTSNRSYIHTIDPNYTADLNYYSFGFSFLADMDANDTAYILYNQSGGTQQTNISAGADTYFSGYLVA